MHCCSPGGRPGRERLPRDLGGGHANPATGQVRTPSRSVPRRCARHLARRRGRGGRLPAASLGGKDVGDGRGGAWDTGSNTVVCEGAGREGCAARMTGGARGGTCATTPVRPRRLPRSAGRQVRPGARRVLPDLRGAPGGNGFYLAGLSGAPYRPSRHTGRRA